MITLEDFTLEIRAKIPEYMKRCTRDLYSGVEAENFDPKNSTIFVENKLY